MTLSIWVLRDFLSSKSFFFSEKVKKIKKPGPGHIFPVDTEIAQGQSLNFCEYISDGEVSSPSLVLKLWKHKPKMARLSLKTNIIYVWQWQKHTERRWNMVLLELASLFFGVPRVSFIPEANMSCASPFCNRDSWLMWRKTSSKNTQTKQLLRAKGQQI